MLAPDALKPTSDNPDEAGYLLVVIEVYERLGVWLVLDEGTSEMARNLAPNDSKRWRVRLLLGYKRGALVEEIQTDTGTLTRKALLSVTRLGAGYYESVHRGPTLMALSRAIESVTSQIKAERDEHFWWSAHRDEFRVVSRVSDKLGGAVWPSESIWEQPHYSQLQARYKVNAGNLMEAAKLAQLAAFQTEWCARAIHEYIDATTRGASRAVTILRVAVVAGKIAETILTILAIGQGVIRLLSRKGVASAAGADSQRLLAGERPQLPAPAEPAPVPRSEGGTMLGPGAPRATGGAPLPGIKRPPATNMSDVGKDLRDAIDYARQQIGLRPVEDKTLATAMGMAESVQYKKLHREFLEWLAKNPSAFLAEKNSRLERVIYARWRAPGPTT